MWGGTESSNHKTSDYNYFIDTLQHCGLRIVLHKNRNLIRCSHMTLILYPPCLSLELGTQTAKYNNLKFTIENTAVPRSQHLR
jgi:hypothetical protein